MTGDRDIKVIYFINIVLREVGFSINPLNITESREEKKKLVLELRTFVFV